MRDRTIPTGGLIILSFAIIWCFNEVIVSESYARDSLTGLKGNSINAIGYKQIAQAYRPSNPVTSNQKIPVMGKKGLIPLNVSYYFDKHSNVQKHVEWLFDNSWLNYKDWSSADKKLLDTFYRNMLTGTFNKTFNPEVFKLPIGKNVLDNELKKLYFSYVAHSIWLEMTESVPWRLHDYNDGQIFLLISGKTFVEKNMLHPNQDFFSFIGKIAPSEPSIPYNFMTSNKFVQHKRIDTIEQFLIWIQINLYHSSDKIEDDFLQKFRRDFPLKASLYPILDNIDAGETSSRIEPIAFLGCHGAADTIRWVLRSVNIPSKVINYYTGHGGIELSSERIRLLHIDDIYALPRFYDTGLIPVRRASVQPGGPDVTGGSTPTGGFDPIIFLGHQYISPLNFLIYDYEYQINYQSDFGKSFHTTNAYNRRQHLAAFSYPLLNLVRRVLYVYEIKHINSLILRESILDTIKTEYKKKVTPELTEQEINAISEIVFNHINDKLKPIGLDSHQALSKYPEGKKIYKIEIP